MTRSTTLPAPKGEAQSLTCGCGAVWNLTPYGWAQRADTITAGVEAPRRTAIDDVFDDAGVLGTPNWRAVVGEPQPTIPPANPDLQPGGKHDASGVAVDQCPVCHVEGAQHQRGCRNIPAGVDSPDGGQHGD